MRVIDLINKQPPGKRRSLVAAGALAGVASTIIVAAVNIAAQTPDVANVRAFVIFLLGLALYILCYRYTGQQVTAIVENALFTIKIRVTNKIRRMELQGFERVGTAEIYDRITENMTVISTCAAVTANLLRTAFMVVVGGLYLLVISVPAFVLVAIVFAVCIAAYMAKGEAATAHLRTAGEIRLGFFDTLTDLLEGFKELKFSRRRGEETHEEIKQTAAAMRESTLAANLLTDDNLLLASLCDIILLSVLVFVFPVLVTVKADTLSTLIAVTLFISAPIGGFVGGVPAYIQANLSLENIEALEKKLDENAGPAKAEESRAMTGDRLTIEAREIQFEYKTNGRDESFHIGPVSLTIPPGEVLFIVGGNGSGKSTLLKVLTGLYLPTAGALSVNEAPITAANVQSYREKLSTIFADFHLFKKLYGFGDIDGEAVHRLLALMQLERKTAFANRRFTTTRLSTGQRKRLALIVALLEDRPVYAFDEWAADQDPDFRRYFYEEVIPDLKRRGKTVLVVTHDDRYFHCADRVATMEYGKLRSIDANGRAAAER